MKKLKKLYLGIMCSFILSANNAFALFNNEPEFFGKLESLGDIIKDFLLKKAVVTVGVICFVYFAIQLMGSNDPQKRTQHKKTLWLIGGGTALAGSAPALLKWVFDFFS